MPRLSAKPTSRVKKAKRRRRKSQQMTKRKVHLMLNVCRKCPIDAGCSEAIASLTTQAHLRRLQRLMIQIASELL